MYQADSATHPFIQLSANSVICGTGQLSGSTDTLYINVDDHVGHEHGHA